MPAERLNITGRVHVRLIAPDGAVRGEQNAPNAVVRSGERLLAKLLLGRSRQALTDIAVGAGTVAPAATDAALQQEVLRKRVAEAAKTIVEPAAGSLLVTLETVFGPNEPAAEATLAELGLFNAANELYARAVLSEPVLKSPAFSLVVRWEIAVGGTTDGE